ncbi:ATPase PAAT isoform X2 [Callorhinchus milii]|uniref:ATPase PAAT isoform X2 n=1 Tax=Callorhinchus milii TaxID=7868 RepID=UPI001C3F5B37|nr:ATPase PAAT isoform X2 [Callorhinchus milii]
MALSPAAAAALLSSSWRCVGERLGCALRLAAARAGTEQPGSGESGEAEAEAWGRSELVTLEQPQDSSVENACVLYLQCSPQQPADIVFLELVSEAKTMEVYTEQEYCGTARGQRVDNLQTDSADDDILLYKKYFKLEYPVSSCELKLLSLGGKEKVRIGKILLGVKPASVKISRDFPPLGKSINLERVQTMMDSMGTKLSPGAQHLMNMVQFQQKNQIAIGGLFQGIFGGGALTPVGNVTNSLRMTDALTDVAPSHVSGKGNAVLIPKSEQPKEPKGIVKCDNEPIQIYEGSSPSSETNSINETSCVSEDSVKDTEPILNGGDLKGLVSTFLCKQVNGQQNAFSSEMLPFLQNLCGQVNELRLEEKVKRTKNTTPATENEGMSDRQNQQPFCSALEKHIIEHMESMEKRLKDYIDHRINTMQADLDAKFVSLTDLLQSPPLKRTATKNYELVNNLTNGEL